MDWLDSIIGVYALLFCLLWCHGYLGALANALTVRRLESEDPPAPDAWPSLTVVVTACNEGATLADAMTTLLAQDYPQLQIILIDDRSTDNTGAVVDSLAAQDERIRPVHVAELPDGWLGKVHALHTGAKLATCEWILFSDADVHFGPGILRRAVATVVGDGSDHLALLPDLMGTSFWLNSVVRAFLLVFLMRTKAGSRKNTVAGVGAFNLVRRSALARSPGFEAIRLEIADDVGLVTVLRDSGATVSCAAALHDLRVALFPSLRTIFLGGEKNFFAAAARFSVPRMIGMIAVGWAMFFAPAVALVHTAIPNLWVAGLACFSLVVAEGVVWKAKFGEPFLPSLGTPVAHMILSLVLLRSGLVCGARGSIEWRGTLYRIEDLRKGIVVKM